MKLVHGDCMDVMPTLAPRSVDLVLCDLPYGMTACPWDRKLNLNTLWEEWQCLLGDHGTVILTASQPFTSHLILSNPEWFRHEWIWVKNRGSNFATTKRNPLKEHESVLVFGWGDKPYNPIPTTRTAGSEARCKYPVAGGGSGESHGRIPKVAAKQYNATTRGPRSVLYFDTERGLHPAQKPVALMEYLIRTYTNPGETVLDNCMGSGTTGVACVNTGREFVGIEKDARHFAVAEKRIADAEAQLTLGVA